MLARSAIFCRRKRYEPLTYARLRHQPPGRDRGVTNACWEKIVMRQIKVGMVVFPAFSCWILPGPRMHLPKWPF